VTRLIDDFADDGRCDLATALADPVPAIVMALLLGFPETEWTRFRERSSRFLRLTAEEDMEGAMAAVMEIVADLSEQIAIRRQSPGPDMLSDIATLRIDGQLLSDQEAMALAFLLLGAGHETTVGGIGGMLYHVGHNPDVQERLLNDPSLIPSAIEEALRLEPPLPGLGRTLVSDAAVDGVRMRHGDRVMLLFGSANRDPIVFEEPEEFRVDRQHNRHLTFGSGIHRCVGAPLARLEMRVVLEEVLRRVPRYRIEDEALVRVRCEVSRSYRSLPIAW
jgi:cytochrome P450